MTIYDEKRRFTDAKEGISYRHRFWVGVKEQNTKEGQAAVAARIKGIFEDLKESHVFKDVFLFPQRYSRCEWHRIRDYRKQHVEAGGWTTHTEHSSQKRMLFR